MIEPIASLVVASVGREPPEGGFLFFKGFRTLQLHYDFIIYLPILAFFGRHGTMDLLPESQRSLPLLWIGPARDGLR
jgi:hypothetical protein